MDRPFAEMARFCFSGVGAAPAKDAPFAEVLDASCI